MSQFSPFLPIFSVFCKALESIFIINKNRKYFWELKNKKECYSIVFSKIFLKINGVNMKKYGQNGNFGAIFQPSKCSMFALRCLSSHAEHRTHVRDVRCSTLPKFDMFDVRIFDVRSNTYLLTKSSFFLLKRGLK